MQKRREEEQAKALEVANVWEPHHEAECYGLLIETPSLRNCVRPQGERKSKDKRKPKKIKSLKLDSMCQSVNFVPDII